MEKSDEEKLNDLIYYHNDFYDKVVACSKVSLREISAQNSLINFIFDDFLHEFIRLL
jgi:hypothetical protein